MELKVVNIDWDTDGEEVELPSEVIIDTQAEGIENPEMEVADWLSDRFGWCVNSFSIEPAESPRPGA